MIDKPEKLPVAEPRRGTSCLVKLLLGCGCLSIVGFVLGVIAVGGIVYFGVRMAEDTVQPFVDQGYRRVNGQVVTETNSITEPTVYFAQQVVLRAGATTDLALVCQVAELHGAYDGNIDFFGQVLEIASDAVVKGDVRVKAAQVVTVHGVVEGEITGSYGVLDRHPPPADAVGAPDAAEASDAEDAAAAAPASAAEPEAQAPRALPSASDGEAKQDAIRLETERTDSP